MGERDNIVSIFNIIRSKQIPTNAHLLSLYYKLLSQFISLPHQLFILLKLAPLSICIVVCGVCVCWVTTVTLVKGGHTDMYHTTRAL